MDGVGDRDSFERHKQLFAVRYRFRVDGKEVWAVQYPEYDAVAVAYLLRFFVFPKGSDIPEASFNLEESIAGRFFGAHYGGMHHNMGPAPDDVTVPQFLETAESWLEDYSGVPSSDWERIAQ